MMTIWIKGSNDENVKTRCYAKGVAVKDLTRIAEWHVGEKLPFAFEDVGCVADIQADGDELIWVHTTIKGIPYSNDRVQRWFGDHARFIVGAIKS